MLIMHRCEPLVLIFQLSKILEQRTLATPKFESLFHPCQKAGVNARSQSQTMIRGMH